MRVRVAEIGRRILKHLERPLGIGLYFGIGNAVQTIDADSHKGVGDCRNIAPLRLVLVIALDELVEILIGLEVVMRHALPLRVHAPELPLGERLAAGGGIFQRLDGGFGVAGAQIVDSGAQEPVARS